MIHSGTVELPPKIVQVKARCSGDSQGLLASAATQTGTILGGKVTFHELIRGSLGLTPVSPTRRGSVRSVDVSGHSRSRKTRRDDPVDEVALKNHRLSNGSETGALYNGCGFWFSNS